MAQHIELQDSTVVKAAYPVLADIRQQQGSDNIYVGIPSPQYYVQNGIPIPEGYIIAPIYNNQIPSLQLPTQNTQLPMDADGSVIPIQIQCKFCRKQGTTLMQYRTGKYAWSWAILIMIFFLPLFFIPFLMMSCKDKVHYCPNCGQCVGRKKYRPFESD